MTQEDYIIERLEKLFADTFHIDVPGADTDLLDNGVLDSFQFVEMLMQLEQEFGFQVDIQTIDLDDLRTLKRIAGMVRKSSPGINGADRSMPSRDVPV